MNVLCLPRFLPKDPCKADEHDPVGLGTEQRQQPRHGHAGMMKGAGVAPAAAGTASSRLYFFVNSKEYELRPGKDFGPETTLLNWLRAKGLTGTKLGCGEGGCGACTISVSSFDKVCQHTRAPLHPPPLPTSSCLADVRMTTGARLPVCQGHAAAGDVILFRATRPHQP